MQSPSGTPRSASAYEVLHEPRVWPEYHPGYFGAFVRDPDGNNVEAVHHTFEYVATRARRGRPRSATRGAARRPRRARARSRRGTWLRAAVDHLAREPSAARACACSAKDTATHFVIGRSSAKLARPLEEDADRHRLDVDRADRRRGRAITASKIGRSNGGPVEKYSSTVIAGAHSWPWPLRANCRWHSGHTQLGTTASLPCDRVASGSMTRRRAAGPLERGAARGRAGHRPRRRRRLPPRPGHDRAAGRAAGAGAGDEHRRRAGDAAGRAAPTAIPVVPRGAGTGLSGGSSAIDGAITLSTERMRAIDDRPAGDGRGRAARAAQRRGEGGRPRARALVPARPVDRSRSARSAGTWPPTPAGCAA